MAIQFTKAARTAVKLKMAVDGPSGSGKTLGALALAHGITKGGRIAVADSENGSASLYADRYEFDTVAIPDGNPASYRAIIDAAASAGYDALVIDSLSHAWLWTLGAKEDHDRANPKSNQWTNWRIFGQKWDALMQHILQAPIHIIATMRSKQAYEQVDNGGSKKIVKLGLQPQVRDGAEYEFGIVFSVNQAHRAEATKDRTALFADQIIDLLDPEVSESLVTWMNAGGPAAMMTEDQKSALHAFLDGGLNEAATEAVTRALMQPTTERDAAALIARVEKHIAGKQKNGAQASLV